MSGREVVDSSHYGGTWKFVWGFKTVTKRTQSPPSSPMEDTHPTHPSFILYGSMRNPPTVEMKVS